MALFSAVLFRSRCIVSRRFSSAVNDCIKVTTDEDTGFSTISLCKPPVNSLNYEFLSSFNSRLSGLIKNGCQGLILTSELPTVFCSGLDLNEIYKPEINRFTLFWTALQDVWLNLKLFPSPTVAAINGHAPAGGCLLSIVCDYRIMVDGPKYTIGLNETKVGVVAPLWLIENMKEVIGVRQAELALTQGTLFSVKQAYNIGLIDQIATSKQDLMEKAKEYLDQQSNLPGVARSLTKKQFRKSSVKFLLDNRKDDMMSFYNWIKEPSTVNIIESYVNKLKKK